MQAPATRTIAGMAAMTIGLVAALAFFSTAWVANHAGSSFTIYYTAGLLAPFLVAAFVRPSRLVARLVFVAIAVVDVLVWVGYDHLPSVLYDGHDRYLWSLAAFSALTVAATLAAWLLVASRPGWTYLVVPVQVFFDLTWFAPVGPGSWVRLHLARLIDAEGDGFSLRRVGVTVLLQADVIVACGLGCAAAFVAATLLQPRAKGLSP